MPTTARENLKKKFETKLKKQFGAMTSDKLGILRKDLFGQYINQPSISQLVKMISASVRGYSNALSEGGAAFVLEEVIRQFNAQLTLQNHNVPEFEIQFQNYSYSPTWFGNICYTWTFDNALFREVGPLSFDDFLGVEAMPNLYLAKDGGWYGFLIAPYFSENKNELHDFLSLRFEGSYTSSDLISLDTADNLL